MPPNTHKIDFFLSIFCLLPIWVLKLRALALALPWEIWDLHWAGQVLVGWSWEAEVSLVFDVLVYSRE